MPPAAPSPPGRRQRPGATSSGWPSSPPPSWTRTRSLAPTGRRFSSSPTACSTDPKHERRKTKAQRRTTRGAIPSQPGHSSFVLPRLATPNTQHRTLNTRHQEETPMHRVTRTLLSLAGTVLLILLAGAAQANTLNVPSQYASIQAAIDAAKPGDTIQVAPGIYRESLSCNAVEVGKKDLTLQGAGAGQSVIDPSTANGGPGGRCLLTIGLTSSSLLDGFTLQNGSVSDVYGFGGGMANWLSS